MATTGSVVVLFDVDGTLVRTVGASRHSRAFKAAFRQVYGSDCSFSVGMHGMTDLQIFMMLARDLDSGNGRLREMAEEACRCVVSIYRVRDDGDGTYEMVPAANDSGEEFKFDAYSDEVTMMYPAREFFLGGDLRWDTSSGYVTSDGTSVFGSPATVEPGPGALIGDKEYVRAFLEQNGFALVWTVTAEKLVITGGLGTHGYLRYYRVHWLDGDRMRSTRPKTERVSV